MKDQQGPVLQSLTSLLVVKMLTVLVSTVSNSQVFLLKNVSSSCKCKSYTHFFSKNISVYAIYNDQSFNDTLTNDIISFEKLGPTRHDFNSVETPTQSKSVFSRAMLSVYNTRAVEIPCPTCPTCPISLRLRKKFQFTCPGTRTS